MLVLRFLLFCFKSVQTYLKIFHSKGFVGVEVVNLLSQVSHGDVVLHHLDLGGRVGACLLEP